MNPPIPSPRRLEQLFQNMEDGCITGSEHAELMDLLRNDPEAREAYLRHMEFAGMLHLKAEAMAELEAVPLEQAETPPARQFLRSALAAAAVIAVAAYLATFFILPDPPVASVTEGPNTIWQFERGGLDREAGFLPGTVLALDGGTLDVQTGSGSQLVVEGPARLLIEGPDEVYLPYGRVWVRAGSDQFTVHTKRLKIIDLGTEFGVTASANLDEEIHVAEGRVRVEPVLQTLKPVELTAGEAVRANIVGKLRTTLYDAGSFQTELPEEAPYLHWSFDRQENGSFPATGIGFPAAPIGVYTLDDRNTVLGMPSATGKFGGALVIDTPDRFAQADFVGIEGNLPRTVALWVKGTAVEGAAPGSDGALPLVCWGLATDFGTKWVMTVRADGQRMSTGWGGAWAQSPLDPATNPVLDGNWHHVAYVFTGRVDTEGRPEIIHYLDGNVVPLRSPAPAHPVNTDCAAKNSWALTIGTQLFSDPQRPTFMGAIDELYVFRGALSPGQIRMLQRHNRIGSGPESASNAAPTKKVSQIEN